MTISTHINTYTRTHTLYYVLSLPVNMLYTLQMPLKVCLANEFFLIEKKPQDICF